MLLVSYGYITQRGADNMSDHVYNLLKKHHSVRNFKKDTISEEHIKQMVEAGDRKSTRLNSSHVSTSYAVVCLKKKKMKATDRGWNKYREEQSNASHNT